MINLVLVWMSYFEKFGRAGFLPLLFRLTPLSPPALTSEGSTSVTGKFGSRNPDAYINRLLSLPHQNNAT